MSFIRDVAAGGFPKEAVAMLTGAASHKLTILLKTVQTKSLDNALDEIDNDAYVST